MLPYLLPLATALPLGPGSTSPTVWLYSLLALITQACILHGRGGLAGATCSLGSSSGRWQQQGQTQGAGSLVCFYMPQEVLVCLGMTCDEVRLTMLQNCSI